MIAAAARSGSQRSVSGPHCLLTILKRPALRAQPARSGSGLGRSDEKFMRKSVLRAAGQPTVVFSCHPGGGGLVNSVGSSASVPVSRVCKEAVAAQSRRGFVDRVKWCLTPRSSRAPTACHAGPAGGTLYIFANRARAPHRRCRLNSNVRHRTNHEAVCR